jgi:2'-5' RNA ligase
VSRLGRHIVCVPVAGLDALASVVLDATAHLGDPPDPRPGASHLTLARLKDRAACGVTGAAFHASFDVGAVDLVQSTLSRSGPVYEVVASYPLPV